MKVALASVCELHCVQTFNAIICKEVVRLYRHLFALYYTFEAIYFEIIQFPSLNGGARFQPVVSISNMKCMCFYLKEKVIYSIRFR